jgi:hypothetical protein
MQAVTNIRQWTFHCKGLSYLGSCVDNLFHFSSKHNSTIRTYIAIAGNFCNDVRLVELAHSILCSVWIVRLRFKTSDIHD